MTLLETHRRPGFTLLEMTAVMVILTILLAVGGTLIASALRVDATGATAHHRLTGRTALADRFRSDVSRATTAPDRVGNFVAGPTTLVLEVRGDHVVYEWKDGRLDRIEKLGEAETRQTMPVGTVTAVEFVRGPLVTMRLTEPSKRGLGLQLAGYLPVREAGAVAEGDGIKAEFVWDNSANHPQNPFRPPRRIGLGRGEHRRNGGCHPRRDAGEPVGRTRYMGGRHWQLL